MSAGCEYKRRGIAAWNELAPRYHRRLTSSSRGPAQSTGALVRAVGASGGESALDVACGTGLVTRALARSVGAGGRVVGVDSSAAAVSIARRWTGRARNVLLVNADAEKMAFGRRFDLVTCQYGLFFFPRARAALRGMRRSMKDGGRLGLAVHGHIDMVPFYSCILEALEKFVPDYEAPGGPALDRYGTRKALRAEAEAAGFRDARAAVHVFRYSPGTFAKYWRDYLKYVPAPLGKKIGALGPGRLAEMREEARKNASQYEGAGGALRFPWQVLILTALR